MKEDVILLKKLWEKFTDLVLVEHDFNAESNSNSTSDDEN